MFDNAAQPVNQLYNARNTKGEFVTSVTLKSYYQTNIFEYAHKEMYSHSHIVVSAI